MSEEIKTFKSNSNNEVFSIYEELREKLKEIAKVNKLLSEQVLVFGKDLSVEEAIGKPIRQDFPLQKGKEKLLQANFLGAVGQAFTDQAGYFHGSLEEVISRPLESNFSKAVFFATLNAVLRYLKVIQETVHCKDEEPEECAIQIIPFIKQKYGNPKIALVGLQPAILESLAANFSVRVLDLNPDSIGKVKYGVKIEDGENSMTDVLVWCDFILATGSTITNGTIGNYFLENKPLAFFGTTIAGAAYLMGWERFCACAK